MTVSLRNLQHGEKAQVQQVHGAGSIRRRLLDLGLLPGTIIERIMDSPIGDPICYRVRGAMIALRAEDADQVLVRI
jgi:ferrous iron transport protein A